MFPLAFILKHLVLLAKKKQQTAIAFWQKGKPLKTQSHNDREEAMLKTVCQVLTTQITIGDVIFTDSNETKIT